MPVLKNAKHERFAQELAKGRPASEAYVLAGYAANDGNAIRLKGNERVAERVMELSERAAEKAEWTAADRLKMLADIAKMTSEADPRVAVSAIAEANKMQGSHAPEKRDLTNSDGSMKPPPAVIQIVGVAAQNDDSAGTPSR